MMKWIRISNEMRSYTKRWCHLNKRLFKCIKWAERFWRMIILISMKYQALLRIMALKASTIWTTGEVTHNSLGLEWELRPTFKAGDLLGLKVWGNIFNLSIKAYKT